MSAEIGAVLLDAAGTLIGLESPAARLQELLRRRFGVLVDAEQTRAAFAAEVAYYRTHMLEGGDPAGLERLRSRCAEVLRDALPPSDELAAAANSALVRLLVDALEFKPFAEVPDVLARLRAAGLRLVVASNWDCSLPSVLERAGVLDLVDGVACSAVVGAAKPDPRVLEAALALAGVAAGAAVHVGDSPQEDVGAAVAAGIRPVWVDRGGAGDGAERFSGSQVAVIDSLAGLPALLGV
jgi:putative hydrolase of the HAD superfamily